jgi:ABC-type polysaccharide/polyol phosphate export permease
MSPWVDRYFLPLTSQTYLANTMPQFPAIKCLGLLTWNFMQSDLTCCNFSYLLRMELLRQIAVSSQDVPFDAAITFHG